MPEMVQRPLLGGSEPVYAKHSSSALKEPEVPFEGIIGRGRGVSAEEDASWVSQYEPSSCSWLTPQVRKSGCDVDVEVRIAVEHLGYPG